VRPAGKTGGGGGRPLLFLYLGLILLLMIASRCSNRSQGDHEVSQQPSRPTIEQAQAEHTERWMAIPGVVGTGIGECSGELCIVVYVSEESAEIRDAIPAKVEGYPVRIEVTGPFRTQEPEGG